MKQRHSLLILALLSLLALLALPTLAQVTPRIVLAPRWNMTFALTSRDLFNVGIFPSFNNDSIYDFTNGDDEVVYISTDLMATTNMEFWAVDLTCTVSPVTTADLYALDTSSLTDDPNDNFHPFTPGSAWGIQNTNFTLIRSPYTAGTVASAGAPPPGQVRVSISRLGQGGEGLGVNGQERVINLGRLTFRVRPQTLATFNGTVSLNCTSSFLDRNGRQIVATTYTAPAPLPIRQGYTIRGRVTQQGQTANGGIGVNCQTNMSSFLNTAPTVRTAADGSFTLNVRSDGLYRCQYFSNLLGVEPATVPADRDLEPFLMGESYVPVYGGDHTLQPVILRGGNAVNPATATVSTPLTVDNLDLSLITSAFRTVAPAAFTNGDVNGDRSVNESDLALVTSNLGETEASHLGHLLISAQMTPSSVYPDNRLFVTTTPYNWLSHEVRQVIAGTNRDYWPALSPNGSRLAFVRAVGTGTNLRYAIFTMDASGTGTATQITPANAPYDAFAPSWSPDGTQIAFVRTAIGSNNARDYQRNQGSLSLVDATGLNLRLTNFPSSIYPPSWWDSDRLVYSDGDTIQVYRLSSNSKQIFDNLFQGPFNTGIEDMPNIVNGRLYYRYELDRDWTTVDARLHVVTLDADGNSELIPCCGTFGLEYHLSVNALGPVTYYSVTSLFNPLTPSFDNWEMLIIETTNWPWSGSSSYSGSTISRLYGNNSVHYYSPIPSIIRINGMYGNPHWDGQLSSNTDLHALRRVVVAIP